MAKRDSANLVRNVRLDSKQRALQQALLVPWHQLAESAAAFAEWHMFILWVRAISETVDQLPDPVRSALQSRCPGFLERHSRERQDDLPIWRSLEEWISAHFFAAARAEGWFEALMYYAYKDLRTEQAWTSWKRTKADWGHAVPPTWPTPEQWVADVIATRSLANAGTEQARAVQVLQRVDAERLHKAVADLLELRALALWVHCVSRVGQALDEATLAELRSRCPDILLPFGAQTQWGPSLFFRFIHRAESSWRTAARSEGWYAALRYMVVHHPRYQRLIHYNQRCHDEWAQARPKSTPSFIDWLAAADGYYTGQKQ